MNTLRWVLKFLQTKERRHKFWRESICRKSELFRPPFWAKFFVIHYILMHSSWFRSYFWRVLKFLEIKEGRSKTWVETILQEVWIIWSLLHYFNFKSFLGPNSSQFIRFQCILHDSGVLFSESWNFYKLKRRELISGGNQFSRKSELFAPPFFISILKVF